MKFKQNSDFHFNLFSLKMKNKEKKPLFDFIEKKYLVQIARGNILLEKLRYVYIQMAKYTFIVYTYKEN